MYLPHPATGQLKIKIGLLLCLILLGLVPVCQCWVADWSAPFQGKEQRGRPLALIRLANAAAQLARMSGGHSRSTQARRKEQGPPRHSSPPSPLRRHSSARTESLFALVSWN